MSALRTRIRPERALEPLASPILDGLLAAAGSPSGLLYGPADEDGRRPLLCAQSTTPPPGSAARPQELRIPFVLDGRDLGLAVLAPSPQPGDGDELVATIAHELRGPLTIISGYIELLSSGSHDDARREHRLEIVRSEVRRLHALIDDLLDLERLEHGAARLGHDTFDLVEVLRRQVAAHGGHSPAHEIQLVVAGSDLHAHGDPNRIAQVVSNLLSNAVKYSPDGGLILVRASATDDHVVVAVSDPGLGIRREDQPRIFERFYRGAAADHGDITGTGLGLALSRQIVLAHDGSLEFSSTPGQGSRFWFTLPRARTRPAGVSAASPQR